MSLVFSALVPHSPLLIPSIGKDNFKYLKKSVAAYENLEKEIYAAKPKTILVVSPSRHILDNSFSINLYPKYKSRFASFGNFSTERTYTSDIGLIHHIKEVLENKIPINLFSEEEIDYEIGVPLYYLMPHLTEVNIIPLTISNMDYQCHFNFGQNLKDFILHSTKRIGVIATGDLSHCLLKNSPLPYSPKGSKFDKKLIELLKKQNTKGVLRMDSEIINESGESCLKPILILLGILDEVNYETNILSYEFPFGVGQLIANFKLK